MGINLVDPETSRVHANRIFKRSMKNENLKKWIDKNVDKWLRKRIENVAILPPGHQLSLPEWAEKAETDGVELHRFILGYSSESILKHINDMFVDLIKFSHDTENQELKKYADKIIKNLSHYSVDQMYDLANEFYETLSEMNGPHAGSRKRSEIFAVARNDGNAVSFDVGDQGMVWRQVVPRGLKTVAVKLRNCLGGRHYAQGVRSGETEIWVLVKPDEAGKTDSIDNIEAAMQLSVRNKNITEVKGEGNRVPFEYEKEISDFCKQRNVQDPQIKRRYSGFRGQYIEERAQRISNVGDWEIWIDNEEAALKHKAVFNKSIYAKQIDAESYTEIGYFSEIDSAIKPVMESKTQSVNFLSKSLKNIGSRDYILSLQNALNTILKKNQRQNVLFYNTNRYADVEYLKDETSKTPIEFQKNLVLEQDDRDYKTNILSELFSQEKGFVPWHDEIIFEASYDGLNVSLQPNGNMIVTYLIEEDDVSVDESIIVPATEETKKIAEYINQNFFDFPISFAQYEMLKKQKKYQSIEISEEEKEKIQKNWMNDLLYNKNVEKIYKKYVSEQSPEDRNNIVNLLHSIDPSGHVLNGFIESYKGYPVYFSIIAGPLPNNKILTQDGYHPLNKNWTSINENISYKDVKYFTYLTKEKDYNARLFKDKEDIHIGMFENKSYLGYTQRFDCKHFSFDSFQDKNLQSKPYLQNMNVIKNMVTTYREGESVNPSNLPLSGEDYDIFPALFNKDANLFVKNKRNVGTEQFPIIRLNKPQRYVGIMPDEKGEINNGTVCWVANTTADRKLKIYHLFNNGVSHLSQSLVNKGWSLDEVETRQYKDMMKKIEESGYYLYNGNLLEASNQEIDKLSFENYISVERMHIPNSKYKRVPGDDRAWKISASFENQNSFGPRITTQYIYSVVSTSKRENSKSYAAVSYEARYLLANKGNDHKKTVIDSTKLLVDIINKASLKLNDFDCAWLKIKENDNGYYYSNEGYNVDGTIPLSNGFKAEPLSEQSASFVIKDCDDKKRFYISEHGIRKEIDRENHGLLQKEDLIVIEDFYNALNFVLENKNINEEENNAERVLQA
jgi:hypothetical protein